VARSVTSYITFINHTENIMKKLKVGDIVEVYCEWTPNHVQFRGYERCWEVGRVVELTSYGSKVELVRDRRSKYYFDLTSIRPLTIRPA